MVTIIETTILATSPEAIWNFLTHIQDKDNYKVWHPQDHIIAKLLKGNPEQEGAIIYCEERLGRHLFKLRYKLTGTKRPHFLQYKPTAPLSWLHLGKATFEIQKLNERESKLIATVTYGSGLPILSMLTDWMSERIVEHASITKHMREEGHNLKQILEFKKEL